MSAPSGSSVPRVSVRIEVDGKVLEFDETIMRNVEFSTPREYDGTGLVRSGFELRTDFVPMRGPQWTEIQKEEG